MIEFLRLLFAPCSEVSRQASMSLDTTLSRSQRLAIRIHTSYCRSCRRYVRQIRLMREAFRRFVSDETATTPPDAFTLSAEARDRIKQSLRDR